ncbi:hypothetical protein LR48_Vigan11g134700 [Vigna angularis]|uniref:DNA-directed RNA polymerase subunit n=1 Tax=Phaseolus angularis TaxID=3914 RepID=A0A0L9VTP3_PHAAN|nr:hypothetical protein LR48_Vigan11g134700 [Vigna angularis]
MEDGAVVDCPFYWIVTLGRLEMLDVQGCWTLEGPKSPTMVAAGNVNYSPSCWNQVLHLQALDAPYSSYFCLTEITTSSSHGAAGNGWIILFFRAWIQTKKRYTTREQNRTPWWITASKAKRISSRGNRDQRIRRTTTQRNGRDFCATGEGNDTARRIETRTANLNLPGEEKKEPNHCSMFYLSKIEHKLPLPPPRLVLPIREAIHMELEKLFLDKVIANLGLCISVYDIISIDGGFIFPGDGAPTYTV